MTRRGTLDDADSPQTDASGSRRRKPKAARAKKPAARTPAPPELVAPAEPAVVAPEDAIVLPAPVVIPEDVIVLPPPVLPAALLPAEPAELLPPEPGAPQSAEQGELPLGLEDLEADAAPATTPAIYGLRPRGVRPRVLARRRRGAGGLRNDCPPDRRTPLHRPTPRTRLR
ncbi:MAG: hypothetical protein QOE92_2395, partial [Chloroflexota bacterium]|nr:hypothetical protein [Chloroflexota bacterium]